MIYNRSYDSNIAWSSCPYSMYLSICNQLLHFKPILSITKPSLICDYTLHTLRGTCSPCNLLQIHRFRVKIN